MVEGEFPKTDGDILYASEVNRFAGFGDGTDGAFNETSASTTNLTQGTIYQYTSFNLGEDHTISASTTSQYPIIILVQGDCTIDGTIDLSGKGATTSYQDISASSSGNQSYAGMAVATIGKNGQTDDAESGGLGGRKGLISWNFQNNINGFIINGTKGGSSSVGGTHGSAGGGGGASSDNNGVTGGTGTTTGSGDVKSGGNGGCTLLIICGGDLIFGASSSIDVSGEDGTDGVANDDGGGGGGGSGDILIFYGGSKTDNGVTTDVTGGSRGTASGSGGNGGNGGAGNEKIAAYDTILW